ncbi:MAG: CDP-alcohol phosphatidyltransferase family protein [Ktedonobacteraceae bacterium]
MKHILESDNQFVVDLLTTLRRENFGPIAWWRFIVHAWGRSCKTARDHPTLKRSWVRITVFIALLAGGVLLVTCFYEGTNTALRLLPGFLCCVAWQQSDLFWHLGLNRQVQTRQLLANVGMANVFTWLRGLGACYLLGRLAGGISTPSQLALAVFVGGVATDILDGQVARWTQTSSKLGQIGDCEADFCLYLAITLILIQNAVLFPWLGIVMLLRFCVPLLAALGSYFLIAQPVHFGSTVWGKYAGLGQCLYFLALLAPPFLAPLTRLANLPLLIVTLILLIAAPIAQIMGNIRTTAKGCESP